MPQTMTSAAPAATPEEKARRRIDELLEQAGWLLQKMDGFNRNEAVG